MNHITFHLPTSLHQTTSHRHGIGCMRALEQSPMATHTRPTLMRKCVQVLRAPPRAHAALLESQAGLCLLELVGIGHNSMLGPGQSGIQELPAQRRCVE